MAMQGSELKTLRRSAGMSQAQLAEAIGMARETIGAMERDQAPIELRTELAVRYRTEGAASGPRSRQTLYENATEISRSLLNDDPVTDTDVDEVQRLLGEWLNAGGGTVGYYLLMGLSFLVSSKKAAASSPRFHEDLSDFSRAWNALAKFTYVGEARHSAPPED